MAERGRRPWAFFVFELENNTPTVFFTVFVKISERISIDTAGKSALKLGNLSSLKVIRGKRANAAQSREILQTFVW